MVSASSRSVTSRPDSDATATRTRPTTGTALPTAHAISARVVTPGSTGRSGTPEASARAVTGRLIRSMVR
jgi:hypothetical protein